MKKILLIVSYCILLAACEREENNSIDNESWFAFYPIGQNIAFDKSYIKQIANLENGKGYGTKLEGNIIIKDTEYSRFAFFITSSTSFEPFFYLNVATTSGNGLLVESIDIALDSEILKIEKLPNTDIIEQGFRIILDGNEGTVTKEVYFSSSATGNGSFHFESCIGN